MKTRNSLKDLLKICIGRRLSEVERRRAETEEEIVPYGCINPDHYTGGFDNIFKREGKIVRFQVSYTRALTPDASLGAGQIHDNYYCTKRDRRVYDRDGLLETREVIRSLPFGPCTGSKFVRYEPPGCFFGKVEERH